MNQDDIKNNTRSVVLFPDIAAMNVTKKGTLVTIGAPSDALDINDVLRHKKRVVLLVVDAERYDELTK